MTTPHNIVDGIPDDPDAVPGYLAMHGPVSAARVTFYPGVALPHIELWTEKPGCDPDTPDFHYFNAFAPVWQGQPEDEWLQLMLSGQTTMLGPLPSTDEEESTPE